MNFLAPLFALGMLAIGLPILFHLIRRSPKERMPFSSLMFLSPSPPRLAKRSRIDQWILLLLRASALVLLALAFTRPFLRQEADVDLDASVHQRVAILIDTSASMRRGDLWRQTQQHAEATLAACRPRDQVGVYTFDASPRTVLPFSETQWLDAGRRDAVVRDRLRQLGPTWRHTDLGQALLYVVGEVDEAAESAQNKTRIARRIVLISDLQQGSELGALATFEWPSDVSLEIKKVATDESNAGLDLLADTVEEDRATLTPQVRVRIYNDPASRREAFGLAWTGAKAGDAPVEAYVPPGESRVVRVPRPSDPSTPQVLQLSGDTAAFDNTLYVPRLRKEEMTVLYLGKDSDNDSTGLRYYLERAVGNIAGRTVDVSAADPLGEFAWEKLSKLPLAVVASDVSAKNVQSLRRFMREGGTLLYVVTAPGNAGSLAELADVAPWAIEDAKIGRYAMLRQVSFDHPIFAPLAGAQYNDFTKIHFWKYRVLNEDRLGDVRVLARFEKGDPALLEKAIGAGRLLVLATGWHPADSQLALSSKFVPLMTSILDRRFGPAQVRVNYYVGDRIPLPAGVKDVSVRKPDGQTTVLDGVARAFADTDEPGAYTFLTPEGPREASVNIDPRESKTSPLAIETLQQMGARLAARAPSESETAVHLRQMRDLELEGRQQIWRWLALAVIVVLLIETVLAGRRTSPPSK
jgi:hypothetical protein